MNYRELIEWAGGCWHEPKSQGVALGEIRFGGTPICKHCGVWMEWLNTPMPSGQIDPTTWEGYGWLSERMTEMGVWETFIFWVTDKHYWNLSAYDAWRIFEQLPPADRVSLIEEWRQTL